MENKLNSQSGLDKDQVVGLVDSEGMFFAASYERNDRSVARYTYNLEFKITQMAYSKELLIQLQRFFNCGRIVIDNAKTKSLKFTVTDITTIVEVIIPFFDTNPLLSSKFLDYQAFREIAMLIYNSKVLTKDIHVQIENIRKDANEFFKKLSGEETFNFSILSAGSNRFTPGWVAGFIEGDGSFQFSIGSTINPSLEIAQSRTRRVLLEQFVAFFNGGSVKPAIKGVTYAKVMATKAVTHRYALRGINKIILYVIPVLDKYTFYSIKGKDYADWKELISLYKEVAHATPSGLAKMKAIKANMNAGRAERKN